MLRKSRFSDALRGALVGFLVMDFFRNGKIGKPTLLYLALDGAGLLFMLSSPGHVARSQERGGLFAVPDYASWTFSDKVLGGISATFANVFFQPLLVFTGLCALLFLAALVINRKVRTIVLTALLLIFAVYEYLTDYDGFVTFHDYSFGLPDLDGSTAAIALTAVIGILILAVVWLLFEDKWEAGSLIYSLMLGAGARIIMGFSQTLFGSSFRTFIPMLTMISLVDGYLLLRIFRKLAKNAWKVLLLAILFVTACLYYRYNYNWLIWCWEKLMFG